MTMSRINKTVSRSTVAIVTVIIAGYGLAMSGTAQSSSAGEPGLQPYTNADCPTGYQILIDNQCMDFTTGYIVLASKAPARRYTNADCPKDYVILMDDQCINYTTGYIEVARDSARAAIQAVGK